MAVNNASALDALFLQHHEQVVAQQFPQATPFTSQILEGGGEFVDVNQKGWKANAYLRQDASNAWGLPGMDFPAGTTMVDKNYYVYRTKYAKSHEINGSTYNDLKKSKDSLLTEMNLQTRLLMSAAAEHEQAALGDGTGKKGIISSATTTVLTMSTTADGNHAAAFGVDLLIEGGMYDIMTTAGALADNSHADIVIPAGGISRSANTVTISAIVDPADGSYICYANSYGMYPNGIRYLIDGGRTGEFQSLDASVEPYLNSSKTNAGGQEISPAYLQNVFLKHLYSNGGEAGMKLKILSSPTQIAGYAQYFWNQVRFTGGSQTYEFGTDKGSYNGTPFQALTTLDPDCLIVTDMSDWRKLNGKKLGVHSEDGLTWRQKTGANNTGSDNWYINYGWEGNFAILTPRKHAILTYLSTTGLPTAASRFGTS